MMITTDCYHGDFIMSAECNQCVCFDLCERWKSDFEAIREIDFNISREHFKKIFDLQLLRWFEVGKHIGLYDGQGNKIGRFNDNQEVIPI